MTRLDNNRDSAEKCTTQIPFADCRAGQVLCGPYAGYMRLRRWAYHRGFLGSESAGVPVICVGNLSAGGTGKTPMVAWVVEQLKAAGKQPAVLTRGYKAVEGASDEAELLKQMTGVGVVVNPDRVAGAKAAVGGGADVLVMDDGFQHLRLKRDLDMVLIDGTCPRGSRCCLPLGLLREPVSALRDADAVVITRTGVADAGQVAALRRRLEKLAPRASIHLAAHRPVNVIDPTGTVLPVDAVTGKKGLVFCGIGNPGAFGATVRRMGVEVVDLVARGDHCRYDQRVLDGLSARADRYGADVLLTTQKDHVKLAGLSAARPLWQVVIRMEIADGREELSARIRSVADSICD